MEEILRDIEGFEGYKVSDQGNIYSVNYNRTGGLKKLKTKITNRDYVSVCLSKNNKKYSPMVHRLVARAFPEICGEWFEGCVVNHINCITTDNRAVNLEIVTQSQNIHHNDALEKRIHSQSKPVARYSLDGKLMGIFLNAKIAEIMTGADNRMISACCTGKRKTHHGSRWAFIDLQL